MKKSLLLFAISLGFAITVIGQGEISLRIGNVDSRVLNPGDKVSVPVYCDNISGSIGGWQFYIRFDGKKIKYLETKNRHVSFPDEWYENSTGSLWAANWYDEKLIGVSIEPGILFELVFEYLGGETSLEWATETEYKGDILVSGTTKVVNPVPEAFKIELINGCVCSEN